MTQGLAIQQAHAAPGHHILLDFYGARDLCDIDSIKTGLTLAAQACGATILDIKLHSFGTNAGVTGVALLAESHISIHTWPESDFAALDVFMCGQCDARKAIAPLEDYFAPKNSHIRCIERGLPEPHIANSNPQSFAYIMGK